MAFMVLRILIIINWLFGVAILALLTVSFAAEQWTMTALSAPIMGMRAIMVLGLAAIPLNFIVLRRLVAMVETVRAGDAFVAANAYRLQTIAWVLLTLQVLSLVIGLVGRAVSTAAHPLCLDAGFSISGWLAVLLTFVLARVFAAGALMREDLKGTV
jgi:hypothetical protein